jgi:hypothetical protein
MMSSRFILATLGSSVGLCLSFSSSALAVTFAGTTIATWGTPSPATGVTFSGVGTNIFSTGTGQPNVLKFTGSAFSVPVDNLFKIGDLDYFNGITNLGSNVTSVPLNLQLGFSNPSGVTENFTYGFRFDITTNTGNREADADSLVPLTTSALGSFVADGLSYTLQLGGFSQDGGATIVPSFKAYESESTKGSLYAKITRDTRPTPNGVPEPGVLLGLLGISALVWSTRRPVSVA